MYVYLEKFKTIIDKTDLADQSKKQYKLRLKRLSEISGHDIDWVLDHCKETFEMMKEQDILEPQTVKAYINSILALFKYTKNLKVIKVKGYKCWVSLFNKVKEIADQKYETLEASDKQIKAYVPWIDIIKKRESLDKNTAEYLLLSLYTMIPPCRADLNEIRIYYDKDGKETENYLVIYKEQGKMKLIYNEFKSKSKRLQQYEKWLPSNLQEVIKTSLKSEPRDYLIISPRTKKPYYNVKSYTTYFDRILKKVFEKNVTINTLRHSFVNSIDFNKMTPMEKTIIANDLMHSKETMDRYRLAVPASESHTGTAQVCEVVCRDA